MIEYTTLLNDDPFNDLDPTFNGMGEPEPIPIIDEPSPIVEEPSTEIIDGPEFPPTSIENPEPTPIGHHPTTKSIGSNNSNWPCACTGLYI